MRVLARIVAVVTSGAVVAACDPPRGPAPATTVRDSSGILITETTPGEWPPKEVWRISPTPDIDIGVRDGNRDYELFQVQGAATLAHGGIVVAEFGARLRYYDRNGVHIRTLERAGQGPGEAGAFSALHKYRGDSLLIVTDEMTSQRSLVQLLILDSAGNYGRNVRIGYDGTGARGSAVAWLAGSLAGFQTALSDGSFLVTGAVRLDLSGPPGNLVYGTQALMRFAPDGRFLDTIAPLQSGTYEHRRVEQRQYELLLDDAEPSPVRSRNSTAYRTTGDQYSVTAYILPPLSGDDSAVVAGANRREYRLRLPLSASSNASRALYIDRLVEVYTRDNEQRASEYRTRLNSLASPDSLPALQDLHIDNLGNMWLEIYDPPGASARARARQEGISFQNMRSTWIVLAPDGSLIGTVVMPPELEVLHIDSAFVLGLWYDAYGVAHVRRHGLVKN